MLVLVEIFAQSAKTVIILTKDVVLRNVQRALRLWMRVWNV